MVELGNFQDEEVELDLWVVATFAVDFWLFCLEVVFQNSFGEVSGIQKGLVLCFADKIHVFHDLFLQEPQDNIHELPQLLRIFLPHP